MAKQSETSWDQATNIGGVFLLVVIALVLGAIFPFLFIVYLVVGVLMIISKISERSDLKKVRAVVSEGPATGPASGRPDPVSSLPADWYPDQCAAGFVRYFDGAVWTNATRRG